MLYLRVMKPTGNCSSLMLVNDKPFTKILILQMFSNALQNEKLQDSFTAENKLHDTQLDNMTTIQMIDFMPSARCFNYENNGDLDQRRILDRFSDGCM